MLPGSVGDEGVGVSPVRDRMLPGSVGMRG